MENLAYPANTHYVNSPGYLHALNAEQEEALRTLQELLRTQQADVSELSNHELHPVLILLRYLRANGFHANKACDHIIKNINWRSSNNVTELSLLKPEEILGCGREEFMSVYPHWHSGYDVTGRPVLYQQYGKFHTSKIKKMTTIDAIVKYHIWEQETWAYLCYLQSLKTSKIVETVSVVFDILDMTVPMVTFDFITILKNISQVDQVS